MGCRVYLLCGGFPEGPPQWSEQTAKPWNLAIGLDFRIHECIFQEEHSDPIQTRKKNVDVVSRQMALERDQGLGHTLYTLSEFNFTLLSQDHDPSILDEQEGATTAAFKAYDC